MTRTERRAADRRGTAPSGVRRALGAVADRSADPIGPPHRLPRAVPPPLV